MKSLLLSVILLLSVKTYCQDTSKITRIDSQVRAINKSGLNPQRDSIINNYPDLGLYIRTYLTTIIDGKELKKFVNNVHSSSIEQGVPKESETTTIFYFDKDKLIKVEEFGLMKNREFRADWYFDDDKPLYYTFPSDKGEERANLLLTMAKAMVEQISKRQ